MSGSDKASKSDAAENNSAERRYLDNYDPSAFERPNASVDTAIFTVFEGSLQVLLVRRQEHPFADRWSLVGGFIDVHSDKDLEGTARRKLFEKTGVKTPYLEQYGTVGSKTRDPRCWSLTTVYFALLPHGSIKINASESGADTRWETVSHGKVATKLAFDHDSLLQECWSRLRNKVLYTSLPLHLMGKTFTLGELQAVYEILLEADVDQKSFRRRILGAEIIEETKEMRQGPRRPAKLYRRTSGAETHFFLRNIEGIHD